MSPWLDASLFVTNVDGKEWARSVVGIREHEIWIYNRQRDPLVVYAACPWAQDFTAVGVRIDRGLAEGTHEIELFAEVVGRPALSLGKRTVELRCVPREAGVAGDGGVADGAEPSNDAALEASEVADAAREASEVADAARDAAPAIDTSPDGSATASPTFGSDASSNVPGNLANDETAGSGCSVSGHKTRSGAFGSIALLAATAIISVRRRRARR